MEAVFLGEYIRQRREDLGLTQAQLSEGICEPMTLSRLENGKQAPSYGRIKTLLERLGLPGSRYFALLRKNEAEIAALKKDIRGDVVLFERAAEADQPQIRERAMEKLATLEQLAEPDDPIIRQYILGSKATLGTPSGPYSWEERLDMLMEAIRLTVPRIDLDEIRLSRYSIEETMIINQIARCYAHMGQKRRAIDIYQQLLKYVETNDQELPKYANHFSLIAHNYAINLSLEKRYREAVEIAEKGKQICTKYGDYQFLPGFLAILAECYYFMGEEKTSRDLYFQACYLYKATGNKQSLQIIEQEMYSHLGLKLPD